MTVTTTRTRSLSWAIGLLAAIAALLLAACSSSSTFEEGTFAVTANFDIGAGEAPGRLLVGLLEQDGTRVGSPDQHVELEVMPVGFPEESQRVPGTFTWIVENATGLYRGDFQFDRPGTWAVTVYPESGSPLPPVPFGVLEETFTPNVGEAAIVAPTPTLDDGPLEELTTDSDPDPRFYEISLEDALQSGRKTVLVFSTPAYCQTAACGPLLNNTKTLAADHADVNFIHVEVYTGLTQPDFAPDPAHLAPALGPDYWNLQSEPWVFVIDEGGTVTARFEGVMDPDELAAHLG